MPKKTESFLYSIQFFKQVFCVNIILSFPYSKVAMCDLSIARDVYLTFDATSDLIADLAGSIIARSYIKF